MIHGSVSNGAGREVTVRRSYFCPNFIMALLWPPYGTLMLGLFDGEASPRELPNTTPWKPQNRFRATMSTIHTYC